MITKLSLRFISKGLHVMRDAVLLQVPGATMMLNILLQLRVNSRTRRTLAQVTAAFSAATHPRWFDRLVKLLWNQYRLWLIHHYYFNELFIIEVDYQLHLVHILLYVA